MVFNEPALLFTKRRKRLPTPQKNRQKQRPTTLASLASRGDKSSSFLSGLCEGLGETAGGKRSSYITHPDQTLKSLPKNSATANNTAPGLHLCKEGAGWARLKSRTWNTESVTQPFCLLRTNPLRPRSPRTSSPPDPVPYPPSHHNLPTWRSLTFRKVIQDLSPKPATCVGPGKHRGPHNWGFCHHSHSLALRIPRQVKGQEGPCGDHRIQSHALLTPQESGSVLQWPHHLGHMGSTRGKGKMATAEALKGVRLSVLKQLDCCLTR